jgi:hypothetical protein
MVAMTREDKRVNEDDQGYIIKDMNLGQQGKKSG